MQSNFNDIFQMGGIGGTTEKVEEKPEEEAKEDNNEEEKPINLLEEDGNEKQNKDNNGDQEYNNDVLGNASGGLDDSNGENTEPCFQCKDGSQTLYHFDTCNHSICCECYYRHLFLYQIKDLGLPQDKIVIKCKCNNGGSLEKNLDEILEILAQKADQDRKKGNVISENLHRCRVHENLYENYYCINCKKSVCQSCVSLKSNEHYEHRVLSNARLEKKLIDNIKTIQGSFDKTIFSGLLERMVETIKESVDRGINEKLKAIDDLVLSILDYRRELENYFKEELTRQVKKLKILKTLYFNYYLDKEKCETAKDIKLLLFVNSIQSQFESIKLNWGNGIEQKITGMKLNIESLRQNLNFNLFHYSFSQIPKGYSALNWVPTHGGNSVPCLIETKDERIITGSVDFKIKVWEENNQSFEESFVIEKMTGAVICLYQLQDGRIASSSNNESSVKIWNEQNRRFILQLSLTAHNDTVTAIAQLKDGRLVTGSKDKTIIIWDETNDYSFVESQRLPEDTGFISVVFIMKDSSIISTPCDGSLKIYKEQLPGEVQKDSGVNNVAINEPKKYSLFQNIQFHKKRVRTICQLRDGRIASSGDDKAIVLFKIVGKQYVPAQALKGHKSDVNTILECFDGRIASSSKDRTIILWKMKKDGLFEKNEVIGDYPHGLYPMIQLKDGRLAAIATDKNLVLFRSRECFFY